jgi:hypothetical protein
MSVICVIWFTVNSLSKLWGGGGQPPPQCPPLHTQSQKKNIEQYIECSEQTLLIYSCVNFAPLVVSC